VTHDEIGELLGAYALGAISPEEREDVDRHVSECSLCAAEAAELASVGDQLAQLAAEREPPPALRIRLMNIVELERRQWAEENARASTAQQTAPVKAPWWKRVPALAYGAGAVILVAALVLAIVVANRSNVTVHQYHGSAVAQVVKGIDVGAATATVGVRGDHKTDMSFSNLPVLPKGLAYEMWLIPAKGKPVPVGGFNAGPNHAFSTRLGKDAAGFADAAVTVERAPGNSPLPTSNPFIVVSLKT
jgi:anti-sigma-K factor RskA